jgi:starch-binding outer membrane protein SusE/F
MKNKLVTLLSSLLLIAFAACEKEENRIFLEEGTAPVLTASRAGAVPLSFATKDQEAVKLSWTNPNYKFTTGTSSQGVNYQIEIDTAGANFTNPKRKILNVSNDLSLSITQDQFNDYMLNQLLLDSTMSHNMEIRIRSTIGSTAVPLFSNVLQFTAKPYAIPPKVDLPTSGELYIVGNATPGGDATGWNNPVPVPSQQFTRVSPTFYTLTIDLNPDKSYLLLPVNGSWNDKYGGVGAGNNSNNVNGDDFKRGGSDLKSPAIPGTYKIEVDFQIGKFTVTKL